MCLGMVMLLNQKLDKSNLLDTHPNEIKVYKFMVHIINKLETMEKQSANGTCLDG